MDMKLTTLNVYATPRYWGDTKVDEMYDTEDGNNIPCRNGDRWEPIIDIETGRITNWEQGKTANIHYKVADECGWAIFLDNGERLMWVDDGYVPDTLCPKKDGFGDYIIMDVDENGMIAGWKFDLGDFKDEIAEGL